MKIRYGNECAKNFQIIKYGEKLVINDIIVSFYPSGHILGSAQILIENKNNKILITGDYKTIPDDTTESFKLVKTDTLITEATFGLPIFKHPDPDKEILKLLESVKNFSEKPHIVGAYALGKAQRIIRLLRKAGYDEMIYMHGAIEKISNYYIQKGIMLGKLKKVEKEDIKSLKGKIIIAPPSALKDRWIRKFDNVRTCLASGWMMIKQRAKQSKVDLPLVISDHADWNELTNTIINCQTQKVWITHGREDALKYWCEKNNIYAQALSLKGKEEH
ncbi:MAG: hypothetical protein CFH34_00053 [Alphaproteobacteria bacterium MarineAlpha9_Bin4]|nr:MAG: hypothetical protein CFH34_00053 [Alphaproteobacteria bacterium MarineAlpha9_Bin4]